MLFSYKTVITRVLEQHGSLAAALQSCYIYRYIHSYIHTYTHTYSSNNNNNNARTMFMVLSSWPIATTRVHPVHLTNVGQRRTAADPPTKPTDFGVWVRLYRLLYDLHPPSPFIITQPEGCTHFTVPRRMEGWVNLCTQHAALYSII